MLSEQGGCYLVFTLAKHTMKYKAAFDSAGMELGTPSFIIKPHFTDGKPNTKRASYFHRATSLHPNSIPEKPGFFLHFFILKWLTRKNPFLWILIAKKKKNQSEWKSGSYLHSLLLGMCCLKDTVESGFTFYQVCFLQDFKNPIFFLLSFPYANTKEELMTFHLCNCSSFTIGS